ncbi:ubiquitin-binding protein cue5 [Linnemannia schmuckeri]|uniref:Ubiquitin-binding protein cue5 n=1 Tax=Linnemannia schmuckeri TaxID=64567 RepID=A0A9P5VC38_9FUNG|nr:ubiquitin-binding protein cue5 [Linnemannia schmuckeri]
MSATDKDISNKPKEDDISALLDDDIDEHEHEHDNDTTHLDAPASDKRPGSPQLTKKDSPKATTVKDEDDVDEDINIHSSSTAAATVVPVAPLTTSAAAASPAPAAISPPTPAAAQAPTQPVTNPAQSEREARLAILTEAFPTVEKEVCEFVLESHRGNVEASINALLEISDPEFHAEPAPASQPVHAPAPAPARIPSSDAPPALPLRQTNELVSPMGNLNLGGQNQQPPRDIDPILLASTSTSEQQLRADEDFARTLAAMDEYRARDRQNVRGQQNQQQQHQEQEGPGFVAEMKELMDEELPKIKERFNVAADTTKKKMNEWYTQFKANRAEAAARQQQQQQQQQQQHQQGAYRNGGSSQGGYYDEYSDRPSEPIRFGSRADEDEPLSRNNRTSPPLDGPVPPLPNRPYDTTSTESSGNRTTTVEDELQYAINANPGSGLNPVTRR